MKKVQKKVGVLEAMFMAVVGFVTGIMDAVVEFLNMVFDVEKLPAKPEPKKPESKVVAPVKVTTPKKLVKKEVKVGKKQAPTLKKRAKK